MSENVGTGYKGDGWLEEAESCSGEHPQYAEIIMMEDELGILNKKFKASERDNAWSYFHELKAKLDQQQRKTA